MFPVNAVIVTAAGSSVRFGGLMKKEFLKLDGHSILYRSAAPFFDVPGICACVVTCRAGEEKSAELAMEDLTSRGVPVYFVEGGPTRQKSVFNGLKELMRHPELNIEIVAIHDGDRPFIDKDTIMDCMAYAKLFGGAVPARRICDTIIRADEEGFFTETVNRDGAYTVQTPQCFRLKEIFMAHAREVSSSYTDDASLFAHAGNKVAIVNSRNENRKITYQSDLGITEEL